MAARGRARLKPAGLREPRTTGTARGGGERRPNGAPGGGGGYPGAERSREPYPREGGRSGRKARGAPRGEPVPSSRELMEIPRREPGLPNSRGPPRREPGPSPRDLGPPSHREPELRPREPRRPRNRDPGPNYRDPQDPYVRELELSPREPRRPLDGESELGRWYKRGHPNRDTGPGFHDLGGSPNREPIPGFHDFKGHRFREPEQDTPETREPFYRESGPDLRWPHNSLPVLSLRESRGPPTREHGLQNIAGPPTREAGFGQCDPEGSLSRELGLQNLREPYNRRVGLSRDETVASNRKEHELSLPDLRGPHRKDMHFTPYSRQQKVNPQKPLGSYSTQLELGPHLSRDPYGRRETGSDFHEPREPYNRNFSQHLQDPLSPYNREPELFSLQPRDPNYRKHEVASKIPNGPCNGEIELRVPVCRSSYGDSEHSRLPRQDPYGRESVLDTEESDKLGYKKHTIAPQLIHGPGSRAYDLRVQQYTASCSRDLEKERINALVGTKGVQLFVRELLVFASSKFI
ncbi:hypothetical protein NDU88_000104 [Pleurodeles waltl]|uniref:Uncharacterized protein n=1 Tax=Pleurodeles waltl TaxID=8319 RepID=A0AAV7KM50_PLEWA|nr:hypothetical protein NDU88_000104 [Pleurodeles waltl]